MKATAEPSGEKTGVRAFWLPGTGVARSAFARRAHSCHPCPAPGPMYTSVEPSGESAMGDPPGASSRRWSSGNWMEAMNRSAPLAGARRPKPTRTPMARAPAKAARVTGRARSRRPRPLPIVAAGSAEACRNEGSASARPNASAEGKRSAGSFSRARATAASTWGGTVRRVSETRRASPVRMRASTAWAVGPPNGGSPVSIS